MLPGAGVNANQAIHDEGTVTITTEPCENGIQIRIKDDGPGIPPHIRSRIFDPFFTTKEGGKGTGLGLSISRKIIETHSGTIEFFSEEGVGTEFCIWLPLKHPHSEEQADNSGNADS